MYTRKIKTGWQFRELYKNPVTGKWQQVSVVYGKNNRNVKKQAQIELNKKIEKKLNELQSGVTDITFDELQKKYVELARKQLAYMTYYRKLTTLGKISKEFGKDVIAKNITPQFLNRYLDSLIYDKGYANQTAISYKSLISSCYEFGIRYGYLSENPTKKVKITLRSEHEKEHDEIENKYLEDDEYRKIILDCDQQKRPDLKDFFEWLYLTGMRCGEGAAIQKKNIYETKDGKWYARVNGTLITIRKEKNKAKRHIKTKNAKTFAGDRDVLLPPAAIEIAKEHCKGKKANEYIFVNEWPTSDGYFVDSKLNKVLKSVMKRQNIKKKLVVHMFRHTHVSKLAELGVPLYVIQRRVGHGNSRVTQRIYLHVTKAAEDQLQNKLDEFGANLWHNDNFSGSKKLKTLD